MKLWIVTVVDYNDSCDGKARVLGAFKTHEEAKTYVDEDIREWIDARADEGVRCDFDMMRTWCYDNIDIRCEWNIEEVEI